MRLLGGRAPYACQSKKRSVAPPLLSEYSFLVSIMRLITFLSPQTSEVPMRNKLGFLVLVLVLTFTAGSVASANEYLIVRNPADGLIETIYEVDDPSVYYVYEIVPLNFQGHNNIMVLGVPYVWSTCYNSYVDVYTSEEACVTGYYVYATVPTYYRHLRIVVRGHRYHWSGRRYLRHTPRHHRPRVHHAPRHRHHRSKVHHAPAHRSHRGKVKHAPARRSHRGKVKHAPSRRSHRSTVRSASSRRTHQSKVHRSAGKSRSPTKRGDKRRGRGRR